MKIKKMTRAEALKNGSVEQLLDHANYHCRWKGIARKEPGAIEASKALKGLMKELVGTSAPSPYTLLASKSPKSVFQEKVVAVAKKSWEGSIPKNLEGDELAAVHEGIKTGIENATQQFHDILVLAGLEVA